MSKSRNAQRSRSREAAVQALFCLPFVDEDDGRAAAAVEATRVGESLAKAIGSVGELRRALDAVERALKESLAALSEAAKPAEERRTARVTENPVAAHLYLDEARQGARASLQEAARVLRDANDLFDAEGFTARLLRTYQSHAQSIDGLLDRLLEGWSLRRLAGEDRAILRLGATELVHFEDVPPRVAINEYVELAKNYGDEESSKLINGVLDRVAREVTRAAD